MSWSAKVLSAVQRLFKFIFRGLMWTACNHNLVTKFNNKNGESQPKKKKVILLTESDSTEHATLLDKTFTYPIRLNY